MFATNSSDGDLQSTTSMNRLVVSLRVVRQQLQQVQVENQLHGAVQRVVAH